MLCGHVLCFKCQSVLLVISELCCSTECSYGKNGRDGEINETNEARKSKSHECRSRDGSGNGGLN